MPDTPITPPAPAKAGINWTNVGKDTVVVLGVILIGDGAAEVFAKSVVLPGAVLAILTGISGAAAFAISALTNFLGRNK